MRLFRIAFASLVVFLPTMIFTLLTLALATWSEWALDNWTWAKESQSAWDRWVEWWAKKLNLDNHKTETWPIA